MQFGDYPKAYAAILTVLGEFPFLDEVRIDRHYGFFRVRLQVRGAYQEVAMSGLEIESAFVGPVAAARVDLSEVAWRLHFGRDDVDRPRDE